MANRSGLSGTRRALLGIGATAMLVAASPSLATAAPASAPGWRATFEVGAATDDTYSDNLVAAGPGDAWADWSGCGPNCPNGSVFTVSHWNGRSWHNLAWPASLHPYQDAINIVGAIGASSADNL